MTIPEIIAAAGLSLELEPIETHENEWIFPNDLPAAHGDSHWSAVITNRDDEAFEVFVSAGSAITAEPILTDLLDGFILDALAYDAAAGDVAAFADEAQIPTEWSQDGQERAAIVYDHVGQIADGLRLVLGPALYAGLGTVELS